MSTVQRVALGILLVMLGQGCAHGPPTPESKEVDDLTIEGTKAISEGDVKGKILTSESSWLPWWVPLLGHTGWFDETSWQADVRRITRYYEVNGYYQARVLDEAITDTKPGHVKIRVKVREGLPARLSTLTITGLDALTEPMKKSVFEDFQVKEGDIFLQDKWEQAKGQLTGRLRELGYADVLVVAQAVVQADEAKVEVTLTVTLGPRYHFGEITVATDPKAAVPGHQVKDVAAPDLDPKGWYSPSALDKAQAHVQGMGVFAGVKVNGGKPDPESETVPVAIEVHEAPFHTLRGGFGVNGDFIRQEVHLIGEYTDRNLGLSRLVSKDTLLDKLSIKAKVGWAFLPTVVAVAAKDPASKTGPIFKLTTQYEIPRIFNTRTISFVTALDLSRALDVAFDYYGGELKVGYILRPRLDLSIYPSLNFDTYIVNAPVNVRDNVPPAVIGCPLGAPCIVSFLDVNTELDHRDNKLEPKEGYYLALDLQGGVAQTDKFRPFFKVMPEVRGYVSFGGPHKDFTLAGKLRAGTLVSTDNQTPIVVRFFSGGSNMRGFNQRRLSPQWAVPTPTTEFPKGDPNLGETVPVGGNGLLEGSLELRWNLWGDLTVAIFTDWGMVTTQSLGAPPPDPLKTQVLVEGGGQVSGDFKNSLYAAVGFGVRYRTPLGPIRLDLGFRLPNIGGPLIVENQGVSHINANQGCFFWPGTTHVGSLPNYGGSPENLCNFHLSIGEAF